MIVLYIFPTYFYINARILSGPPQITSKSPANITEFVETNVTLVCTVIAYPNPTTVWKRIDTDGKMEEIKRTSHKFDGNYTIYNARLEDSGKYICNASNALGYQSYATDITIKPGKVAYFIGIYFDLQAAEQWYLDIIVGKRRVSLECLHNLMQFA